MKLPMRALRVLLLLLVLLALSGCKKPYRVGDYVLVEWEKQYYPAYIIRIDRSRYRVHFEGYDSRWDQEVKLESIKGRVTGHVASPPPPEKVRRAEGLPMLTGDAGPVSAPYKAGDRIRVRWRGSVYPATIISVVASDKFLIRYDGHEAAWDETVGLDRVIGKR
jgi:hypothetical protein